MFFGEVGGLGLVQDDEYNVVGYPAVWVKWVLGMC